ncbi:MAG: type II toxin-antitoxin system ParD family antitoxin [Spirulinaceae cyanobacterium]
MTSINISLPESLKIYVEEQVSNAGYGTVSEYLRELIRQDKKRKAQERLETLLLESLDTGVATPMTAQDWQSIREAVREKAIQHTLEVGKVQSNNQDQDKQG